MAKHLFAIDAFVLLPDHLHCLWTLPDGDRDFSKRWRLIKSYFSRKCDDKYKLTPSASRQKKKEQAMYDLEWGAGGDITLDETIGRE